MTVITTKEQVLIELGLLNISYQLYDHPPIFTTEEAKVYYQDVPGAHVKNLFLRDKKKTCYLLITVLEDKRVDLVALSEQLKIGRLSFASNDDLRSMLNVEPGSVTPIAIVNDQSNNVKFFIDRDLLIEENISIHPMENTSTIHLLLSDLLSLIKKYTHQKAEFIDIPVSDFRKD